jgi:hypothetical protein
MTPAEVFYLLLGGFIGIGYRWVFELSKLAFNPTPRPLRLVRTRFDTVTPATVIEPVHRLPIWITYTHAYIMRGEMCKRTPLNVREMAELTGLSSRQQKYYLNVLEQGRVIAVIPSGGVRWLVNKPMRRKLLTRLPYPREYDPPPFGPRQA